jgi:cytochrome c peroxidase
MQTGLKVFLGGLVMIAGWFAWEWVPWQRETAWNADELRLIQSLSLHSLEPIQPDFSNSVGDSHEAAEFGHALFFDKRLSANQNVSCASCHQPENYFTDSLPLPMGLGPGTRHTPSLVGLSYSPWYYWDGRRDSQWSQALAPLEAKHEQGIDRTSLVNFILQDQPYLEEYEKIFGVISTGLKNTDLSDTPATPIGDPYETETWQDFESSVQIEISKIFSNVGKALAAYQRLLHPGDSRFDEYTQSLQMISAKGDPKDSILSRQELLGLRLFIGKGNCVDCHNGPLFTNHEFHNTGVMPLPGELPALGRFNGIRIAREDPFNCLGAYSDADPRDCVELRFARDTNDTVGAHKTPTLRNIAETSPYMHTGQQISLSDVIEHYNEAPTAMVSHNEAKPLKLRRSEMKQLEAFLRTLSAPLATDSSWLNPPD